MALMRHGERVPGLPLWVEEQTCDRAHGQEIGHTKCEGRTVPTRPSSRSMIALSMYRRETGSHRSNIRACSQAHPANLSHLNCSTESQPPSMGLPCLPRLL